MASDTLASCQGFELGRFNIRSFAKKDCAGSRSDALAAQVYMRVHADTNLAALNVCQHSITLTSIPRDTCKLNRKCSEPHLRQAPSLSGVN